MSVADKALWIVERNSDAPWTLNSLAETCGVSRSHLSNAFATVMGLPVMKYVRARRLAGAARKLADGASDILELAFDAGYGSHEAFTRAFRDEFGVTPESVRNRGSIEGLDLELPLKLNQGGQQQLEKPAIDHLDSFLAVGLEALRTVETSIEIPIQWRTFMSTYYDAIPSKDGIPIGIITPTDEEGRFGYMCATEVARFGVIGSGLTKIEIPARSYAVFEHRGHVSKIFDTYAAIWDHGLTDHGCIAADAPAIEHHNRDFDPETGEGGLTIWIPLAN